MAESETPTPKTIREEVSALLGFRWDTLVEWTVIGWLSVWFWSTICNTVEDGWSHGPFEGIKLFLQSIGVSSPVWFESFYSWMINPEYQWISKILIVISAVCCVAAVRNYRLSGLRTVALFSAAMVCEMRSSFFPIVEVLALAAIPALAGCAISFYEDRKRSIDYSIDSFYSTRFIIRTFITQVVLLYLAPVIAPLFLVLLLVASFQVHPNYDPIEDLSRISFSLLYRPLFSPSHRLLDMAKTAESIAVQLAGNRSRTARSIASQHLSHIEDLQRAEIRQSR